MITTGKLVRRIVTAYVLVVILVGLYQFWRHPDFLNPIAFAALIGAGAAAIGSLAGLAAIGFRRRNRTGV